MGHWFKRSKPHFESLGPSARISYSTWFLKNRCVFDRKNETQKQREDAFNRAAYLYGGDPALSPHEIRRELISRSKKSSDLVACTRVCSGNVPFRSFTMHTRLHNLLGFLFQRMGQPSSKVPFSYRRPQQVSRQPNRVALEASRHQQY